MTALRFKRFRRGTKPRKLLSVRPLPTMLTLGNLLCGFAAIILATRSYVTAGVWKPTECLYWSGILIFVAMIFDIMDGRVARLTKSMSQFGLEMDSLADVVSFGVAPGVIVKCTIDHLAKVHWLESGFLIPDGYVWLLIAVFVSCAALRLARYNVEASSGHLDHFFGIPSPAAAGCVASLVVMVTSSAVATAGQSPYFAPLQLPVAITKGILLLLPFLMMLLGIMMVTRVRYPHLGDRLLGRRKSFMHMLILLLGLVLIIMQHEFILVLGFNGYMISGLINEARQQMHGEKLPEKKEDQENDQQDTDLVNDGPKPEASP